MVTDLVVCIAIPPVFLYNHPFLLARSQHVVDGRWPHTLPIMAPHNQLAAGLYDVMCRSTVNLDSTFEVQCIYCLFLQNYYEEKDHVSNPEKRKRKRLNYYEDAMFLVETMHMLFILAELHLCFLEIMVLIS